MLPAGLQQDDVAWNEDLGRHRLLLPVANHDRAGCGQALECRHGTLRAELLHETDRCIQHDDSLKPERRR
jgi:hypothetical protein